MLKRVVGPHGLFILVLVILSVKAISGIQAIPFHPDESTYLYMSTDFFEYLSNPFSLTSAELSIDHPKIRYRLIDPPLTRYFAGFGLMIYGRQPLAADWNWSTTVEGNETVGALPDNNTLLAGRI